MLFDWSIREVEHILDGGFKPVGYFFGSEVNLEGTGYMNSYNRETELFEVTSLRLNFLFYERNAL